MSLEGWEKEKKAVNKDKKEIVIGRMRSGKHRFHQGDEVYDRGGICRTLTATDYKHPVCVLEERNGDKTDRKHYGRSICVG